MKIALLTDLHWGARGGSPFFINHFKNFYDQVFFPTIQERDINKLIILGDTFDKRPSTLHTIIKSAKEIFFDRLQELNIETYIIVGNHDCPFKSTLDANSPSLLFGEYANIQVIDSPTTIKINDTPLALIPWICSSNYNESIEFIKNRTSDICMGHLELSGFQMHLGQESREGMSVDLFRDYDQVFTGHYHHRSTRGNITYLGAPYEMTWHDHSDPKGFHLFDLNSRELEFIQNPHSVFIRVEYDDTTEIPRLDENLRDKFVRLVVTNKTDYYKFDKFTAELYSKGCHDVKIIENLSDNTTSDLEESVNLEDTLSILMNFISNMNLDDEDRVKAFMRTLYAEAISESVE